MTLPVLLRLPHRDFIFYLYKGQCVKCSPISKIALSYNPLLTHSPTYWRKRRRYFLRMGMGILALLY